MDVLISTPQGVILSWRTISPEAGRWQIPGGTVYFGEMLENAAKRVAQKELSLDLLIELCHSLKKEIYLRKHMDLFILRLSKV